MSEIKSAKYSHSAAEQKHHIQAYYRFQSRIYDLTRWSFLFGRRALLDHLPFKADDTFELLEVGCGTGYNLQNLAHRFPLAQFTGLDLSSDMLNIARRRLDKDGEKVILLQQPYEQGSDVFTGNFDVILFSYSLTMINPQWPELLAQAAEDLRPGGVIAVTDFHDTRLAWFGNHMANHHVRMEGHLLPVLQNKFEPLTEKVIPAYGGVWRYFIFVGRKGEQLLK